NQAALELAPSTAALEDRDHDLYNSKEIEPSTPKRKRDSKSVQVLSLSSNVRPFLHFRGVFSADNRRHRRNGYRCHWRRRSQRCCRAHEPRHQREEDWPNQWLRRLQLYTPSRRTLLHLG